MNTQYWHAILVAVCFLPVSQGQAEPFEVHTMPRYVNNPGSILHWWNCLGARKEVTHSFPSDFRVGSIYRLVSDVVIQPSERSRWVSKYWVCEWEPSQVEAAREEIQNPRAAKDRETQAVRKANANMIFPSESARAAALNVMIRGIERRRETRIVLNAGTKMRFQQIWLEGNLETGVRAHAYAEVLDGPLQGKWVDISFLTDRDEDTQGRHRCNINPRFLQPVAE